MSARHARAKGQPRRSWAPLDSDITGALLDLTPDANPLTPKQTAGLIDQMDGDLFRAVRRNAGNEPRNTQETFEHLAPRRGARR